jgi:hypothetical protein
MLGRFVHARTSSKRRVGTVLAVLTFLAMLAWPGAAEVATAQPLPIIMACTPTLEAIERCEAAGRNYDTLRCRCGARSVSNATEFPFPKICAVVCPGTIDLKTCRCLP